MYEYVTTGSKPVESVYPLTMEQIEHVSLHWYQSFCPNHQQLWSTSTTGTKLDKSHIHDMACGLKVA